MQKRLEEAATAVEEVEPGAMKRIEELLPENKVEVKNRNRIKPPTLQV